jgi:hypothetical protein
MGEVVDLFSKTKVSATCLLCKSVHSRVVDTDSWGWYLCTDRFVRTSLIVRMPVLGRYSWVTRRVLICATSVVIHLVRSSSYEYLFINQ